MLLEPAFEDVVHQTQQTFRAALKAMAEPGVILSLSRAPALDTLEPATYALALSLLDSDTPVWLAPAFDTSRVRANLAFHCGCPVVGAREQAAFALLAADDADDLADFDQGSDRDPDRSCTIVVQLSSLGDGAPAVWRGPGIEHARAVCLPVNAGFWPERESACHFPRGLDMIFTAGLSLMGLPRTTHVQPAMEGVAPCM